MESCVPESLEYQSSFSIGVNGFAVVKTCVNRKTDDCKPRTSPMFRTAIKWAGRKYPDPTILLIERKHYGTKATQVFDDAAVCHSGLHRCDFIGCYRRRSAARLHRAAQVSWQRRVRSPGSVGD